MNARGTRTWVFHAGALGDCVLVWPMLRAMLRQNMDVCLVAHASHAQLTQWAFARERGTEPRGTLQAMSGERPEFSRLWQEAGSCVNVLDGRAAAVMTFVADHESRAGRAWHEHAARAFPSAHTRSVGPPGSHSRAQVWADLGVERVGTIECATDGKGVVMFVGAGGQNKRWVLDRWLALASRLRRDAPVRLVAGPVEHEQWPADEQSRFVRHDGEFFEDLLGLSAMIGSAAMFIGCDSGPTHLAAQLGVATLALFGPTDSNIWRPVGPAVRVLAPEQPGPMSWLADDMVEAATRELMRSAESSGTTMGPWPRSHPSS